MYVYIYLIFQNILKQRLQQQQQHNYQMQRAALQQQQMQQQKQIMRQKQLQQRVQQQQQQQNNYPHFEEIRVSQRSFFFIFYNVYEHFTKATLYTCCFWNMICLPLVLLIMPGKQHLFFSLC